MNLYRLFRTIAVLVALCILAVAAYNVTAADLIRGPEDLVPHPPDDLRCERLEPGYVNRCYASPN